ncbi:hypothetical protein A2853_03720 [Candidatus Kaiserbacteria bacterium RIFCSPHIGHO2_01_FULL_55_17]|uniref:Glycosidase n=1 Tax=Candidatus Kaiserbacteria bacterium RIFCSPHIGHO2_01_FULL_55_17 TaxID=1798484 RepID=A0A1F6D7T6_9BACT|nr:MAG: hypothetical protein A2853_03720 [Candidatus Kaiserbacteria bacterium RIFCSPHIGHO2_01_FULL_55_17]
MFIVKRSTHNPLIAPINERHWESRGTFNPSPVKKDSILHLLYRAQGRPDALMAPAGISTIGKALSLDGEVFQDRRQFIAPEESWERYGCEDPRVTFFEGKYYIFYTALGGLPYGPGNIKIACAVSKDLETIESRHLVTPFNAKAAALFPERVGGKITLILTAHTDEPPARIVVAQCDRIEELWDRNFWEKWHREIDKHVINPLRFPQDHVEVGSVPLKIKEGWLFFFSYIHNYFGGGERVFGIEALLLDTKDPLKTIGKTKGPIMVPQEIYERYGAVPDIVFPSGAILEGKDRVDIYYGAADTVCAKASINLTDLLSALIPERRIELAERVRGNPLLTPIPEHPWESKAVFNPAAIDIDGTVHLLYRAQGDNGVSTMGYASSTNGTKMTYRHPTPAYVPREEFELPKGAGSGCEDPRLTRIDDTIYLTYTAFDGMNPWRAALSSISVKDFVARRFDRWAKPQLVTPDPVQDKDACLLPEKIAGKYMLIHRIDPQLCADFLDSLDFRISRVSRCIEIMGPRPAMWDSRKIGIAGPPIKTPEGWLLIYHGVSKTGTYRLGAALLDLRNPSLVISRSVDTILEPLEPYEMVGQVARVVFSCGAVVRGDSLLIYYGGADTVIAATKVSLKKLLGILLPKNLA